MAGSYTLTTTVGGFGPSGLGAPTGSVSFLDTTTGNSVLSTVPLQAAPSGPGWVNVSNPATGNEPESIVAGDFNGDGNLDLAVGNNDPNSTVTILLGDGQGNFNPVTSQTITAMGDLVLVQDFNGDGISDLLLATTVGPSTFTVLLGNGDGTFTEAPGSPFSTDFGANPVVTADFNGDGIPDLAAGGGYYLIILLGNGDGTFTQVPTSSSIVLGGIQLPLTVGDFNDDGIPDLAVSGASISIYLGRGDGTFTQGTSIPTNASGGGSVSGIVAGDFNEDGKEDLAMPIYGDPGSVAVFLGKGDGTFQAAPGSPFASASWSNTVAVGDFNGDGVADLFVGAQSSGPNLTILPGKGDGTFQSIISSTQGLQCCHTVSGDFNGDGVTDIATADFYSSNVQILLTTQTQSVATLSNPSLAGPGPHKVEASYPGDDHYGASLSSTAALTAVAATPVISPVQGNYSSIQTIAITDNSPDTMIYYSMQGAGGSVFNVQYSGPINVSTAGTTTITAYAGGAGYNDSEVVTASFYLNLPAAATPSISVPSGIYPNAQTVTITDATPGAMIYYTTNGSYPTQFSPQYTGPITVSSSAMLTAAAIATGDSMSAPASAQYVISSVAASFVYTIAGDGGYGYTGDGGPATLAEMSEATGVAVDSAGNLYIADTNNNVVRKVAAGSGNISTVAGNGKAGYSGDGGPATSAQLNFPGPLTLDRTGNLFIGDMNNLVVRRVDAVTGAITTYAGNGIAGDTGDNEAATGASLGSIAGLATDVAGNLYLSDSRFNVVRKVTASTGTITTIAGGGSVSNTPPGVIGDGGPATSAVLNMPEGLALDSTGNLYIADARDNVIREVTAATQTISTVAGSGYGAGYFSGGYSGDGGSATSAEMNFPRGIALDGTGNLYIQDSMNDVIRKVSSGTITTYAGNGLCAPSGGDGGPATDISLCPNQAIAADPGGHLYVASSLRVREIMPPALPPTTLTPTPIFSVAPGAYPGPQTVRVTDSAPGVSIYLTLDGTTPTTASQGYLGAVRVDGAVTMKAVAVASGYLPSDLLSGDYTISTMAPAIVTTIAGNGSSALPVPDVPAISVALGTIPDVATDAAGNLYIPDSQNNVVWKVSAATGNATVVAGTLDSSGNSGNGGPATSALLNYPTHVAVDAAGNLYISDTNNNQVREVSAQNGVITGFAGVSGYSSALGDGGPATTATVYYPEGLVFDNAGNLYIADNGDQRVRLVSAATGIITTAAGGASGPALGDQGPATSAYLPNPSELTVDSQGNLYIADENSARVREVTAGSGMIRTIAGMGLSGNSGDGGSAVQAQIVPAGLAVDPAGDLYISSENVVREIPAGSTTITTVAGTGYFGFSGDGGSALLANFCGPAGLAVSPSGALLVADECNRLIRKVTFTSLGLAALPVFSVPGASYGTAQTVTISDSTPGATIYYTSDGTTPTTRSTVYGGPITVSQSEELQAMAVVTGYKNSAVVTATYTISPRTTPTVTVSLSASSLTTAQALTVTIKVSGSTTPTGSVIVTGGGYTSAATTLTNGSASISIPAGSLSVGTDALTATYTPDSASAATYAASSGSVSVVVSAAAKATPTVTVVPSSWNITTAQPLTVTVTVSGDSNALVPTGNVVLSGSYSAQQTLIAGTATFTIPAGSLAAGAAFVTAAYNPDAAGSNAYTAAFSDTLELAVSLPAGAQTALVTVTPSATTLTDEQPVSVSVSVGGASGAPMPTGSVTLDAGTYATALALTNGSVTFQVSSGSLRAGPVVLTATYGGDGNYARASDSATINVLPVLAAAATPAPVSPGSATTADVAFTSGSYAGTMNLSCSLRSSPSGAKSLPTCTFNPENFTLAAGGQSDVAVTLHTTAGSISAHLEQRSPFLPALGGGSALLAIVMWFGVPAKRRYWRAGLVLCITIGIVGAIGCGGGGGSQTSTPPSTAPPTTTAATTTGKYVFTVTGTDTANFRLTASTTVTLTVQ